MSSALRHALSACINTSEWLLCDLVHADAHAVYLADTLRRRFVLNDTDTAAAAAAPTELTLNLSRCTLSLVGADALSAALVLLPERVQLNVCVDYCSVSVMALEVLLRALSGRCACTALSLAGISFRSSLAVRALYDVIALSNYLVLRSFCLSGDRVAAASSLLSPSSSSSSSSSSSPPPPPPPPTVDGPLSPARVPALLKALSQCLCLQYVSLTHLNIGAGASTGAVDYALKTVRWLKRLVHRVRCLELLDLSNNDLDDTSFVEIVRAIAPSGALVEMRIDYNARITDAVLAPHLTDCMTAHPHLRTVSMRGTSVRGNGAELFANMLAIRASSTDLAVKVARRARRT